ncbi:MAG TPA: methylated-DNA--[protein]-cysteine S-methyltransferase [Ignavibacteria bacterium]|nr:methylated-DNA--[protein]-cysteine S-methyltransferase [Ignavibacteria bacterium]
MKEIYKAYFNSEIGLIEITGSASGIMSLDFKDNVNTGELYSDKDLPGCMKECLKQLSDYFKGERKKFNVQMQIEGTDFQKKVWKKLIEIPFGKTNTYKEIAANTGNANAGRAVGNANNKNKIAIIIPCHRVIGSNNKLTGYAGGLWRKEWLISHEKKISSGAEIF